jgi:hypothetical protein
MEHHLQDALDAEDLARLAQGLTRAATFVPDPAWNAGDQGWAAIAQTGAAAAKQNDLDAARQSCKSCHKTWRAKYKATFRTRPIPE